MRVVAVLAAVMLTAGCELVGPHYVYVDSIASTQLPDLKSYFLFSGRRSLTTKNAQYRRLSELAHETLASAGFQQAGSLEEADIVIAFTYGVDRVRRGNQIERTAFVEFSAYDWIAVNESDDRNAIWRTNIYQEGSSGGLDIVVPRLIRAATPYIGTRTGDVIEVVVE